MHKDITVAGKGVMPLQLDPDKYRHHFEDDELTAEQQKEFLEALWHILSIFVDIGWGVDTVQMFLPELSDKALPDSGKFIDSKESKITKQAKGSEKGHHNE